MVVVVVVVVGGALCALLEGLRHADFDFTQGDFGEVVEPGFLVF